MSFEFLAEILLLLQPQSGFNPSTHNPSLIFSLIITPPFFSVGNVQSLIPHLFSARVWQRLLNISHKQALIKQTFEQIFIYFFIFCP